MPSGLLGSPRRPPSQYYVHRRENGARPSISSQIMPRQASHHPGFDLVFAGGLPELGVLLEDLPG